MTQKKKPEDKKKKGRETIEGDISAIRHISNLQYFRENNGLSKAKLARLSGVSDSLIRDIELRRVKPTHVSVITYNKLAAFFKWGLHYTPLDVPALEAHEPKEDTPNHDWGDINSESLKVNASKMYHMLEKIASETQVWSIGEIKRLLASVTKANAF